MAKITLIQEEINIQGRKKIWLAEQLEINPKTLNDWVNYRKIEQVKGFLKLCKLLKINLVELAEDMKI